MSKGFFLHFCCLKLQDKVWQYRSVSASSVQSDPPKLFCLPDGTGLDQKNYYDGQIQARYYVFNVIIKQMIKRTLHITNIASVTIVYL